MPSGRSESPALWSLVLLAASLALVAALAWQAWQAERAHRATAVGVLRDYASLAAGEMVRRATGEIGFGGLYPNVVGLAASAERDTPLLGPEQLRAADDPRIARAGELVRTTFRVASGELEGRGEPLDASARRFLARWLADRSAGTESVYTVTHPVLEGEVRMFVRAEGAAPDHPRVGFEVDLASLGPRLVEAAERAPLLPASLLGEGSSEGGVAVRMTDPRGEPVFSSGWAGGGTLTAERRFEGDYGGLFEGYRIETSLDPRLAPRLVIGGLPRSRLPLLAALALLAAALGAGAFVQVRRERELARLRSEFVARVSHELRTPLAQIRLFAETLLLGRARTGEERLRALEVIDRESARLSALVDNVLRFSRSERGIEEVRAEVHDLGPLLRRIARDVAPLVEGRGARLALEDAAAGSLRARVDPDALRQIVLNLVENAVAHGGATGTVTVGLGTTLDRPRRATLWVEDRGPGVPAKERERIFEPFVRRDGAEGGGAGIGLAVVRDLVRRQGGEVRCRDAATGGARFEVELPLAEPGGTP